jgi:hypothetical protein
VSDQAGMSTPEIIPLRLRAFAPFAFHRIC